GARPGPRQGHGHPHRPGAASRVASRVAGSAGDAESLPEPPRQRLRGPSGGRHARAALLPGGAGLGRGVRRGHRHRHGRGDTRAHVRPLLHDQGHGNRPRHAHRALGGRAARWAARGTQPARARHADPRAPARGGAVKPAVLVVDDEPSIADGLRLILEREGYAVDTAGSIAEGAACLDTQDFALALVDLVLPDGDGIGLLKLLKARDPDLEVIIMTGHGSISKAVEATKEGAFYFVAKPFDSGEMLTLLGKALERRLLLAETSDLKRQLAEQMGYGEMLGSS